MRMFALAWVLLCLSSGCVTRPAIEEPFAYDPALIDGKQAFGETIVPPERIQLLTVSPAMVEFVSAKVGNSDFSYTRFRRLMAGLVKGGFFVDQYDRNATYTADKTFIERKGNCLAYTNMFIALARQANLDARYQLVDTQPSWDVESGFLVRNNHVNVILQKVATAGAADSNLTVDFNTFQPAPDTPKKVVSDAYAESMYYGNLAIVRLHSSDINGAFAWIKRGILTEPSNIDLWNNLGAVYSIAGQPTLAQASYETAYRLDGTNKTAISGLAKSLRQQGQFELAEEYAELALKYQRRNPYYHYAVAEQAFLRDAFEEALTSVNRAIKLKRDNARFYALRALTAEELGDVLLFKKSIALVRKHRIDDSPITKKAMLN